MTNQATSVGPTKAPKAWGGPTEKMILAAKNAANRVNIALPKGYDTDFEVCKAFLDQHLGLTAAKLRPQCRGRWLDIFQYVCPGMFDDAIKHIGSHVTCPFHGGANDFRFLKRSVRTGRGNTAEDGVAMCSCGKFGDGFAVLQAATGMRFVEVLHEINEYLNPAGSAPVQQTKTYVSAAPKEPERDPEEDAKILAKLNKLLSQAKDLDPAYYLARGISREALEGLQDVKLLESLIYMHKGKDDKAYKRLGNFPAYLAVLRSHEGKLVALHRTWLARSRKAKADFTSFVTGNEEVPKAKKLTESVGASGAAVQLHNATGCRVLGLAEGLETSLSARTLSFEGYWPELSKVPVWACYSESNIRTFVIPKELLKTLETVVIFADNDKAGLAAAKAFNERMAAEFPHLTVVVKVPPKVGDDWNDELMAWRAARVKLQSGARAPETQRAAVAA